MKTREQAIEDLHQCTRCKRWITVPQCDHCWVDAHKCPPSTAQARVALLRAVEIGKEAQTLLKRFGSD